MADRKTARAAPVRSRPRTEGELDLTGLLRFDIDDPAHIQALQARSGLHVAHAGAGNVVHLHPEAGPLAGALHLTGAGNTVAFGPRCAFVGHVVASGQGSVATIAGGSHALHLQVHVYDRCECRIGAGVVAYGLRVWAWSDTRLTVGDDCLFSEGVTIRTTDHHGVYDLDTLERLNPPADVALEPHVWVGQDVSILKGVTIGRGSIIGINSVVNRPVPAAELWGGSPARRLRERVSWLAADPPTVEALRAGLEAALSDPR